MNVGSLFSGVGGIELGFEREGFETAWFVEYDKYCQAVLKKRFPDTPIYGDITELDFGSLPRVDIITGGFPCQDISNAGKRVGIEGSRSGLWMYFCEAIRTLRPRYAFIENVSALSNRGLNVVLSDLAKIGYDAEWFNLSASAIGAPHRRERLFIMAYPNGFGWNYRVDHREERHLQDKQIRIATEDKPKGDRREYRTGTDGQDVSNSPGQRQHRGIRRDTQEQHRIHEPEQERSGQGSQATGRDTIRGTTTNWATEPELGRVAHGVPNRVDRVKCLGNAVVPRVAQVFAKAIKMRFQK